MGSDTVRRHLRITGHVQGVFFRATVRDAAEREGVAGWVANRADGSVEAELQGTEDAVHAVIDVAREGPAQARVARVDVREVDPVEGGSGFEVR